MTLGGRYAAVMLRVESAQLGSDDGRQKLTRTETESKEGADGGRRTSPTSFGT